MKITFEKAWRMAVKVGKRPPYRGHQVDLGNGHLIVHKPDGEYYLYRLSYNVN
jgi:hypothetical protein